MVVRAHVLLEYYKTTNKTERSDKVHLGSCLLLSGVRVKVSQKSRALYDTVRIFLRHLSEYYCHN